MLPERDAEAVKRSLARFLAKDTDVAPNGEEVFKIDPLRRHMTIRMSSTRS